MPKALTKYNVSWESEFSFLKPDPTEHEAHCLDCYHNFPISNGEKSDIKKHIQHKMHKKDIIENSSDLVEYAENQYENNNETNISEMPDLLQVGMDGPNINLKFEKDLAHQISDSYEVLYINLGSCCLLF